MGKLKGLGGLWKGIPTVKYQYADDDDLIMDTGEAEFSMELNDKNQIVVRIEGNQTAYVSLNVDEVGITTGFLTKAHARMVRKQNRAR